MNRIQIKVGYSPEVEIYSKPLQSISGEVRIQVPARRFFFLAVTEQDSFFRIISPSGTEYLESDPDDEIGRKSPTTLMIPLPEHGSEEPLVLGVLQKSLYIKKMLPGINLNSIDSVGFQECLQILWFFLFETCRKDNYCFELPRKII